VPLCFWHRDRRLEAAEKSGLPSTALGKSRRLDWKHPNLVLGAVGIFTYVGAEVSIGSFGVNYVSQPDIAGLSPKDAGRIRLLLWEARWWAGHWLALLQKIRTGHPARRLRDLHGQPGDDLHAHDGHVASGASWRSGSSTRLCSHIFHAGVANSAR